MDDVRARARDVFLRALDIPTENLSEFLDDACGTHLALRREVDALLEAHVAADDFLRPEDLEADLANVGHDVDLGGRVGSYRLVEAVGSGGSGTVYLGAREGADFEKRVAIKILRPGLVATRVLERFEAERRLLAGLEHPHIAQLLDGGSTDDGRPYLVLEFVRGVPITEHCERLDLGLEDRLRLFCDVCDAVAFAHRRLIVHRDLKPTNVLVNDEGSVKLLDFGIAKVVGDGPESSMPVTVTAERMLTPRYAAPEQFLGEAVTTATDVYGLGVVLFELVTTEYPYVVSDTTPWEIKTAVCEQPPRIPSSIRSSAWSRQLRGDVDTIVAKALRKEPDRRYTGAAELAEDIRRYLDGRPVEARPDTAWYRTSKFVRRHALPVAGLGAFIVLLVIVALFAWNQFQGAEAARRDQVAQRELADARAEEAEWGRYASAIAAAEAAVRSSNVTEARRQLEAAPVPFRGWEWHHLFAQHDQSLRTIDAHDDRVVGVVFVPGTDLLASGSFDRTVRLWNVADGRHHALVDSGGVRIHDVAVSAQGTHLAVGYRNGMVRVFRLATLDIVFEHRASDFTQVGFSGDGNRLVASRHDGGVHVWDVPGFREAGYARYRVAKATVAAALDRTGDTVAFGGVDGIVHTMNVDDGTFRELGRHAAPIEGVAFDADGKRVVTTAANGSISVWDLSTRALVSFRSEGGPVIEPAFHPRGDVVLTPTQDGRVTGWNPEDGNTVGELRGHEKGVDAITFRADGLLAASGDWTGIVKIWSWPPHPQPKLTLSHSSWRPHWPLAVTVSADGRSVLALTTRQRADVWALDQASSDNTFDPCSRAPGRCLATSRDGALLVSGHVAGYVAFSALGPPAVIREFRAHGATVDAVALHGDRLVTSAEDSVVTVWAIDRERLGTGDLAGSEVITRLARLEAHDGVVRSVGFCEDGARIITAGEDASVRLWDARSFEPVGMLEGHAGAVTDQSYDEVRRRLATSSVDGTLKIWDMSRGEMLHDIRMGALAVTSVAFSRDGSRLAVGGEEGTVRLVDPVSGREIARLHGHLGRVHDLAFGPNDEVLVSASRDETVRVWSTLTAGGSRQANVEASIASP